MKQTEMKSNTHLHLGLDLGSISINTVLMNEERQIIENRYPNWPCLKKIFRP